MTTQKRNIGYTVAAVLVGAVCFVGAKQLTSGAWASGQRALTPTSEVEAMLDRLMTDEPMYQALAENFPSEWATMRRAMAEDVKSNLSTREINARAHARSRQFMLEHAPQLAAAPVEVLVPVVAAEAAFVRQLQAENVQYCADFGMRGLQPGSRPSVAAMAKLNEAGAAKIVAIRAGIDRPTRRVAGSEQDWARVLEAMGRNGAGQGTIAALAGDPSVATPETQCEGTVHLYRAIAELPPEQSAQLFAEITVQAAADMLANR